LQKTPDHNGKDETGHSRHGGEQANLKIGRAKACQKDGQKRRGDIGNAHSNGIDLHVAEVKFLSAKFIFA
jgi:hypothetical protein